MLEPDSRALGLWLITSFVVIMVSDSPTTHLLVIAAAWLVATSAADTRSFRALLLVGISALVLRTVLFALSPGSVGLSSVVSAAIAEGIRFTAILACLGAFLCLCSTTALIRMLPRSMFEAALVLSIAVVFAPQLIRTARDLKEAGRMRGVRGLTLIRSTVIPLLSTALERSISLAESMDSRGFGRKTVQPSIALRAVVSISAATTMSCGSLWMMGTAQALTGPATLLSAALVIFGLKRLGEASDRTTYRRNRLHRADRIVAAGAAAAGVGVVALAGFGITDSAAFLPPLWATAAATSLALPAVVLRRPA